MLRGDTIARDGFPVKFGEALESKGNLQKLVGAVINQHTKLNQKSYNMSSSIGVKSIAKHINNYTQVHKNPGQIHPQSIKHLSVWWPGAPRKGFWKHVGSRTPKSGARNSFLGRF